jgi:hypothetical protein
MMLIYLALRLLINQQLQVHLLFYPLQDHPQVNLRAPELTIPLQPSSRSGRFTLHLLSFLAL